MSGDSLTTEEAREHARRYAVVRLGAQSDGPVTEISVAEIDALLVWVRARMSAFDQTATTEFGQRDLWAKDVHDALGFEDLGGKSFMLCWAAGWPS